VTPKQRSEVVDYLSKGSTFLEAVHMAGATWSAFEHYWKAGASHLDEGRDTEEASFVREGRAERARHCATKRAQAAAAAGSRESADLLAYVRQLEAEEEPAAVAEEAKSSVSRENWDPAASWAMHQALGILAGTGGVRDRALEALRTGYDGPTRIEPVSG
jgi:hypothetical protein